MPGLVLTRKDVPSIFIPLEELKPGDIAQVQKVNCEPLWCGLLVGEIVICLWTVPDDAFRYLAINKPNTRLGFLEKHKVEVQILPVGTQLSFEVK